MRKSKFLFSAILLLLITAVITNAGAAEASITMIPGKTEAVIGETIHITGTIDGIDTDKVYLLLSGNNLDENGVTMVNLNYRASDGKFTEVPVMSDGKWTYQWNTAYIGGFTPGQYTIYAMPGPILLGDLIDSGEIYRSASVVIRSATDEKVPLITISADPPAAEQGHIIRFTGYCEGVNTGIVYLFVTGAGIDKNGAPLGDLSAKASDGSFSEVQLSGSGNSYVYSWDTSVVPPGEYSIYAVTGPDDLSELGTAGDIYAKVSLKIRGEPGAAGEGSDSGSSSAQTGQTPASTPLSLISTVFALMLGLAVFGISRR